MSSRARSSAGGWIVAASIGAVESLKDQLGVCRWNYVLRSMQQSAKARVKSYTAKANAKASPSSSAGGVVGNKVVRDLERLKRTEKSMKQVMDLSCWGPTTVRF